jgi:tetratricopeptide (TPR) repeat protein
MSDERVERFRKMLESSPANHLARFGLANALFDAGRLEEAEAEYRACLAVQPDWMAVHISLGNCLIRRRQYDEARCALQEARRLAGLQGHRQPLEEIQRLLGEIPA